MMLYMGDDTKENNRIICMVNFLTRLRDYCALSLFSKSRQNLKNIIYKNIPKKTLCVKSVELITRYRVHFATIKCMLMFFFLLLLFIVVWNAIQYTLSSSLIHHVNNELRHSFVVSFFTLCSNEWSWTCANCLVISSTPHQQIYNHMPDSIRWQKIGVANDSSMRCNVCLCSIVTSHLSHRRHRINFRWTETTN